MGEYLKMFKWVVTDSQGDVVGRHHTREQAEKNCKYQGDKVRIYNKKYVWGTKYEKSDISNNV